MVALAELEQHEFLFFALKSITEKQTWVHTVLVASVASVVIAASDEQHHSNDNIQNDWLWWMTISITIYKLLVEQY